MSRNPLKRRFFRKSTRCSNINQSEEPSSFKPTFPITKHGASISPNSAQNTFVTSKKRSISMQTQSDLNGCVSSIRDVNSEQLKKQNLSVTTSSPILQSSSGAKKSAVVRKFRKANSSGQSLTKECRVMKCNEDQKKRPNSVVCSHENQSYCQIIPSEVIPESNRIFVQPSYEKSTSGTAKLITGLESQIENSSWEFSHMTHVISSSITKVSKALNIRENDLSSYHAKTSNSEASFLVKQPKVNRSSPCTPESSSHSSSIIKLSTGSHCKSQEQLLSERRMRFSPFLESKETDNSELKYGKCRNNDVLSCLPNLPSTSSDKKYYSNHGKRSFNKRLHYRRPFKNKIQNKKHFHGSLKSPASSMAPSSIMSSKNFHDCMPDVDMPDQAPEELPTLDVFLDQIGAHDSKRGYHGGYAFVVDTNVFIHHLSFIDKLKDKSLEAFGPPHIYISWIVLRELNGLKAKNFEFQGQVREAMQYISHLFDSKHPRVHGQTAVMAKKLPHTYGDINDDLLLSYCKFLTKNLSSNNVCLLTDDKNLCNKAMVNKIRVYTTENLYSRVKPDLTLKERYPLFYKYEDSEADESENISDKHEDVAHMDDDIDTSVIMEKVLEASSSEVNFKERSEPVEFMTTMNINDVIKKVKYQTKIVLKQFLYESMEAALPGVSQSLLSPAPRNFCEILKCYTKYWVSVFNPLFENNSLKQQFEILIKAFGCKTAFIDNADDVHSVLIAIEVIFRAIQEHKPSIKPVAQNILQLTDKCKILHSQEDEIQEDEIQENSVSAFCQSSDEITFDVFQHVWDVINCILFILLDFCKIPHTLIRNFSEPTPPPTQDVMMNLFDNAYPCMTALNDCMWHINRLIARGEQEHRKQYYKELYDLLVQFVPSLKIQIPAPPIENFTLAGLISFCDKADNREKLVKGRHILSQYIDLLHECLAPLLDAQRKDDIFFTSIFKS